MIVSNVDAKLVQLPIDQKDGVFEVRIHLIQAWKELLVATKLGIQKDSLTGYKEELG